MYERVITLIIDSKIDSIALLSKAIRAICNTVVSDEVILSNMELCLVEATTNVINHAYHRKSGFPVEVSVTIDDHHVVLKIKDIGDKAALPVPKKELDYDSKDMSTWPEGGLGLFIIHHVMDEVKHVHSEGSNILTMIKYFDRKAKT